MKTLLGSFHLSVFTFGFHLWIQSKNHIVQHNKDFTTDLEELLGSFHLNGHSLGFHPQTQNIEPPCIV